jgi:hypothetical protein
MRSGKRNTAGSTAMSRTLTVEKILETYRKLLIPLYYCETTHMKRGEIALVAETEYAPEFVMFHPDDFDEVSSKLRGVGRKLVHLRDYHDPETVPPPYRP